MAIEWNEDFALLLSELNRGVRHFKIKMPSHKRTTMLLFLRDEGFVEQHFRRGRTNPSWVLTGAGRRLLYMHEPDMRPEDNEAGHPDDRMIEALITRVDELEGALVMTRNHLDPFLQNYVNGLLMKKVAY